MKLILFSLCFLSLPLLAMTENAEVQAIPRHNNGEFRTEGTFRGGAANTAGLKSLKSELVPAQGVERWTLEFADAVTKKPASLAPQFQVKMVKAESFQRPDGTVVYTEPPKVLLFLRGIHGSQVEAAQLAKSIKRSRFVKEVIPYPAIEDGDMAIEMILVREALVSPYHPRYAESKLVLDLK